ncbi:multicopper oxidase domain-containing protein [Arthrobacter sp. I2-34]|uniref:Multicopper oxidase domain-containing protein n=1 Tax=Arthrobacter hankyongi TaxID=2904801 RepID=A0ABS9L2I1_9MICC|nr:multicopper oxidase domain-containing protein [Arthrobacter hankyongi]
MEVVNLLPASMVVADMIPDDVGTWLFRCHVNDHISAGMQVRYRVTDASSPGSGSGNSGHASHSP